MWCSGTVYVIAEPNAPEQGLPTVPVPPWSEKAVH